ncbi:MAG TPA: adenylate/guanylate cyclase domain-containing protein [Isosphaeraceae bacterium]|jgi:class 3 adenylate cyclase
MAAGQDRPGREELRRLLSERNQEPGRAAEIDGRIRAAFERRVAILVLDMCGFSRLSRKHGIIFYLGMIRQMEEAATPAVVGNGGRVIKQEADNLFAVFDQPAQALEAALDIVRAFAAVNSVVPSDRDLHGSIGIGFGATLVVGDEDLFGVEVNLAAKLGEDVARAGEILLTAAAYRALPPGHYRCAERAAAGDPAIEESYRFEAVLDPTEPELHATEG